MLPEAFIIGPFVIKGTIILTLLGFLLGAVLFVFISPFKWEIKKRHLQLLSDYLITSVVTIIIGKVVFHLPLLFRDPVAVLAYPSDSRALYLATGVVGLLMFRHVRRERYEWPPFLDSMTRFLITSHFILLFLTLTLTTNYVSVYYLGFHVVILLIMVFLPEKSNFYWYVPFIISFYGFGSALLSNFIPTTLFGYHVSMNFYLLIGFVGLISLIHSLNNKANRMF